MRRGNMKCGIHSIPTEKKPLIGFPARKITRSDFMRHFEEHLAWIIWNVLVWEDDLISIWDHPLSSGSRSLMDTAIIPELISEYNLFDSTQFPAYDRAECNWKELKEKPHWRRQCLSLCVRTRWCSSIAPFKWYCVMKTCHNILINNIITPKLK